MSKKKAGLLRNLATRTVVAALPVAMIGAYASGIFTSPPRLAAYDFLPVAEISVSPTTVGIATSPLYGQTLAQINQQLDEMQAIGVQNIRVFVPWGLVEQVDNTYDWSHIDDIMTAAAARNMGVLAEVNATPLWAGPNPNAPGFPLGADTPNVGAFTDFMRDFVNRYDETVSAYEVWNEPNYVGFSNPINPEAYAALLQAVYPVIKNLDPTATVVAGAVVTTQTYTGVTMSPVDFVRRMLNAGAAQYFDALSVHPYGQEIVYSGSCPTCTPEILTPREQVETIMNMISGKKVWITEYGLPTTPNGLITEAQQAAWIKDLLDTWQTYDMDTVGPIFLYTGRDTPTAANPNNPEDYFGLWGSAGQMKAAAEMLKAWIAAHRPSEPTDPVDPVGQFFAAVAQALAQAFAQALANFFAQFAAPAPAATLVATETVKSSVQANLADLAAAADATLAEGAEPASTVTEGDSPIKGDGTTDADADPIAADAEVAPKAPAPDVTEPVVTEPVVTEPVVTEPAVVEPEATGPEVTEPATTQPDMDPTVAKPVADDTAEEAGSKPVTGTPEPSGDAKPAAGDSSTAQDSAKPAKAGDATGKPAGSDEAGSKSVRKSTPDSGTSKSGHRHDQRAGAAVGPGSRSGLVSTEAATSDPGSEAEG